MAEAPTSPAPQVPPGPSDTVPAALTPGELVIPPDVVQYLGQKFFNDLIAQAQADMAGGAQGPGQGAQPPNPYTDMANEDMAPTPGDGQGATQGFSRGGYAWPRKA